MGNDLKETQVNTDPLNPDSSFEHPVALEKITQTTEPTVKLILSGVTYGTKNIVSGKPDTDSMIAEYKKSQLDSNHGMIESKNLPESNVEEDESAPLISISRVITVGVVAAFIEWILLLASMTLLPGLEAEIAAKGGMIVGLLVALYIIVYIGTFYLSIAHQLLQEAGGPPEKRVMVETDAERMAILAKAYRAHKLQPADDYAFLDDLATIKSEYKAILDINHRIQASTMSDLQKNRATEIMRLVEEVVDTARLLHQLNKITPENTNVITHKINKFKEAMIALIEKQANKLSSKFDNINMPDTYEKEDELERLRTRGTKLLAKIENDITFDGSEDKFRLSKIVYERLDELWRGYITAKKNYYEERNEGFFGVQGSNDVDPDVIIDKIFTDINNIYKDIESGVNSVNKKSAMNELLSNKNYFEQL